MHLRSLELHGFKSFGKKSLLEFTTPITAVVGPNGSGKSNAAEAFRFVLGEQSMKGLRSKRGEDLIWGGSSEVPRSNRASVKAVFDNSSRLLDIDFDEVTIERVVYRDGTNEYSINGSKVRLKDVSNLLAGANIGSSGHHIISQGEADRVLAASPRERRQMIEDALGLRVYQYKKEESLKKLEKTEENRAQVEALRKENGPHLRFLERQVKKLEKARELREQLVLMYHEYLKREENYLTLEREAIHGLREEPSLKLQAAEMRVAQIRKTLENAKGDDAARKDLLAAEASLSKLRTQEAEHLRTVGRIEGQVAFEEERIEDDKKRAGKEKGAPIPYRDVKAFWDELTRILDHGHSPAESADTLRAALTNAQKVVRKFVESHITHGQEYVPDTRSLERLQGEKTQAEAGIEQVRRLISEAEHHLEELRHTIESTKDESRELERELFERMAEQSKLHAQLAALDSREENLNRADAEFKREISEGIALIGRLVQGYKEYALPSEQGELDVLLDEERTAQEERRRALEKSKIRLEEMGGGSADEITKEYNETKERDDFLANELADLDRSAESLRSLIDELERELDQRFTSGVEEIGAQFNEFFNMMFGGGSASLKVVAQKKRRKLSSMLMGDDEVPDDEEGEDDTQPGIDIDVSLPKKRIQSLMMLSGGERALTSIALIFAMSQVNPPPFLILDETDAALDEANSRRYGDMITNLSKKSQLILITHNRETMSRSGVLYGITMGADGVSRILSVKFDDAVAVAK